MDRRFDIQHGTQYIIGVKAVNCVTGDSIADATVTAGGKDKVLEALGQSATKLRGELGESLASVQKFDVPLTQATTSSLDALKATTLGNKMLREKGTEAAIPYFQHAIELDPEFASAYLDLGKMYANLGQVNRARELLSKAYTLRQHASEVERFDIDSMYYELVTGNLEKEVRVYREWLNSYPRTTTALDNLGNSYCFMGRYGDALEVQRQIAQVDSDDVIESGNLATVLAALNQFDDARKTIQQALDRKLDASSLRLELYWVDFNTGDTKGMAEQVAWSASHPESVAQFLSAEASVAAYYGQLKRSRDLSRQAAELWQEAGDKEISGAESIAAALRQATFGEVQEAHTNAVSALHGLQLGRHSDGFAALVFAWLGDQPKVESLLADLDRRLPEGTLVKSIDIPTVRARLELSKNNPGSSIQLLQVALPYEMSDYEFGGCFYPPYIRGLAYLAQKEGSSAVTEFQKILDHPGIVNACETRPLAHLGVARAYALQGDSAKAKAAYHDFLTLWKDADPDIAVFQQAKAEYAKLQ